MLSLGTRGWNEYLTKANGNWDDHARRGEWCGYLDRRGEVLLPLKGGKWKGCFHVPKGLHRCWQMLENIQVV